MKKLIVLSILAVLSVNVFADINNEGTPIVINSDTAKYFVLEKNM